MKNYIQLVLFSVFLRIHRIRHVREVDVILGGALAIAASFVNPPDEGAMSLPGLAFLCQVCLIGVGLFHRVIFGAKARFDYRLWWQGQFFSIAPVLLLCAFLRSQGVNEEVLGYVVVGHAILHFLEALMRSISAPEAEMDSELGPATVSDHDAKLLRSIRDNRVVELGPAMGSIHSHAIPKWVKLSSGRVMQFKGYIGDNFSLESIPGDHVVIEPGLLYGVTDDELADPRV